MSNIVCQRQYHITIKDPTDMPLDQAVYVPAAGGHDAFIAAVRGGYVFNLDATTGAKVSSVRFASSVFANSSICYEPVHDKLVVGCWNEWQDWQGSAASPGKGAFKINPTTLAKETHYPSPFDSKALDGNMSGVMGLTSSAGVIWGKVTDRFDANGGFFSLDLTTGTVTIPNNNIGLMLRGVIEVVGSGILVGDTTSGDLAIYDPSTGANVAGRYFLPYSATSSTLAGFCVTGSGTIYAVDRSILLFKLPADLSADTSFSLGAGNLGAINARYNSNDGLIYVPTAESNSVVVFNPGSDTVVATKTGFDSPHDVVFTPTKKFAVQHGATGLKEIV